MKFQLAILCVLIIAISADSLSNGCEEEVDGHKVVKFFKSAKCKVHEMTKKFKNAFRENQKPSENLDFDEIDVTDDYINTMRTKRDDESKK